MCLSCGVFNVFMTDLDLSLNELQFNDKRGFWKIIRHFVKTNRADGNIPPLYYNNTELVLSNEDKADCLNT